jgi:uncharacterized membrane protein YphA (DoxX/SURF4 family)/uncharacterized membrane protein
VSGGLAASSIIAAGIPSPVIWSYFSFVTILAIGLTMMLRRRDWQNARGIGKLLLLGPIFYAAPIAAFGTEHFTVTESMAPLVPAWIPFHLFWIYFVGTCFLLAALSLVTRIQARLSASLLSLTFFLFVVLVFLPGAIRHPENRFGITVALRETSFSGGALALACFLTNPRTKLTQVAATIARYFVAVPVLFFSYQQFRHADHVPGIPLPMMMPAWLFGHALWTYLVAAVYAVAGILLMIGKRTRLAAIWIAVSVLCVEIFVYVPIAIVKRAELEGLNYLADTLMFCGAVLLLASAMPREVAVAESAQSAGTSR